MSEWVEDAKFFLVTVGFIIAAVVLCSVGIRQWVHNIDSSACVLFGHASGFQTKFVDLNYVRWDCFAQTDSGKWVSTKNLHEVNQ
jgi:hypothetical protein